MIRYFVGIPGSGKTTIACCLLKRFLKPKFFKRLSKMPYDYLFSNFDTSLANRIDVDVLSSQKLPQFSYLCVDESGLEFNSRKFKSLPPGVIEFFKKHRHEHCDIDFFSQTWDDTDKQLRDLAQEIWLLRKIGPLTVARCVFKRIGISQESHQLEFQHFWRSVLWQLIPFMPKQFIFCFRPFYYKYFNSFDPIDRPVIVGDFKTTFNSLNIK